jgi:hypothetical protein
MKIKVIFILIFFTCSQTYGQNISYYATVKKYELNYIEVNEDIVKIYEIGFVLDKAGSGPVINKTDTLIKITENEFKGSFYCFNSKDHKYLLQIKKNKKLPVKLLQEKDSVLTILNHAYYLKSYFLLSDSLNKKFPLQHYTFRNGFYAWNRLAHKNYSQIEFIKNTNNEIENIYDSIFNQQTKFTNTKNYIVKNAKELDYSKLRDSLKELPIEYKSSSWYFGEAVYHISKANPRNFYQILEDFPTDKTIIYFAVSDDKSLVKEIKRIKSSIK